MLLLLGVAICKSYKPVLATTPRGARSGLPPPDSVYDGRLRVNLWVFNPGQMYKQCTLTTCLGRWWGRNVFYFYLKHLHNDGLGVIIPNHHPLVSQVGNNHPVLLLQLG